MSRYMKKGKNLKAIKIAVIIAGCILVALLGTLIYNSGVTKINKEPLVGKTNTSNYTENTESASSKIGKSVNESKNETSKENTIDLNNVIKNNTQNTVNPQNQNITNTSNNQKIQNISGESATKSKQGTNSKTLKSEVNNTAKQENTKQNNTENSEKKELNFEKPVEGEVVKEFSKDNLVYSNTLQEWTIHTGIDIKANKTTIVKAAEEGTVKSIKNDPRYGLTVVIEHRDGFQTVYSNLLTSEFVTEGENVKKGQSIGTVGNTAAFEIADEPHLHFEVLKDSVQVDPKIYIEI